MPGEEPRQCQMLFADHHSYGAHLPLSVCTHSHGSKESKAYLAGVGQGLSKEADVLGAAKPQRELPCMGLCLILMSQLLTALSCSIFCCYMPPATLQKHNFRIEDGFGLLWVFFSSLFYRWEFHWSPVSLLPGLFSLHKSALQSTLPWNVKVQRVCICSLFKTATTFVSQRRDSIHFFSSLITRAG